MTASAMLNSFEMRNPIDLSIDPSRATNGGLMPDPQVSPTNARLTKINKDGTNAGDFSQFVDDQNMIDIFIKGSAGEDDDGSQGLFQEIDMGEIDEEERQYLLIDKDTGKVYDLRNEQVIEKITSKQTRLTTDINNTSMSSSHQSSQIGGKPSAWGDWWKEKKRNN
jgi:hypothetical protein